MAQSDAGVNTHTAQTDDGCRPSGDSRSERQQLCGKSVYARLPTFGFGPRRRQTTVTLNRSQRSSTCCGLSLSARSLRSPLRSKMA